MKNLIFFIAFFYFLQVSSQKTWSKVNNFDNKNIKESKKNISVKQLYSFDLASMNLQLDNVNDRISSKSGKIIKIPNIQGKLEEFEIWEASNFDPALQTQFPNIRAFVGKGIEDKSAYLRFSIDHKGIQSMIIRAGKETEFIEPYTITGNIVVVFNTSNKDKTNQTFICNTIEKSLSSDIETNPLSRIKSDNQVLKQFHLALSVTGEYTNYHGGTIPDALAAMNATLTRVNGLYEKDLAVQFILINNLDIIFTDSATDPYTNNLNSELQNTLNEVVGAANYDIGHLFTNGGNNGNAGCIGCICIDFSKGSAFTSHSTPEGDFFDIDYVAHELGHQVGGRHSFSHSGENSSVNMEPGSGSTIMGYAGITGSTDVQAHSDDYFTFRNIQQIQNNLANKACATNITLSNQPPNVNAGTDYTIPKGTAFVLTATANDPEGDVMTYTWEQDDDASGDSNGGTNSFPSPTKLTGPNFRSIKPSTSLERYMPNFETVLTGNLTSTWETVSTIGRDLNFSFTARDNSVNGGQTKTDLMRVTVNNTAGPFEITTPNANESLLSNTNFTILWDVANTDSAPINTTHVNIKLSIDNGESFITLISNTPNDGQEEINIPQGSSSLNAFILIESVNNIYYALSPKFYIDFSVTESCETYNYVDGIVDIPDGIGSNEYGMQVDLNIAVPANENLISKVEISTDIEHTYISDLYFGIKNPANQEVVLWSRQCGSENNILSTFSDNGNSVICNSPVSGTIQSFENLSNFNNNLQEGNWTFFAKDGFNQDTGVINSVSIEICTSSIISLGVDEIESDGFEIRLYPNPNRGNFFLEAEYIEKNNFISQIFNAEGKLIHTEKFHHLGGKLKKEFNIQIPRSTYFLILKNEKGKTITRKFIVK